MKLLRFTNPEAWVVSANFDAVPNVIVIPDCATVIAGLVEYVAVKVIS